MDKKNVLMAYSISKEKREEIENKSKNATDRNLALMIINNNIITIFTNYYIHDK